MAARHATDHLSVVNIYSNVPVHDDQIRLLRLHPTTDNHTVIMCTLEVANLSESPQYEALSYTWGESNETRTVLLQLQSGRHQPIEVTTNLYECLLHIRRTDRIQKLWIDALCINQHDLLEKEYQVRLMPRIYSTATRVLAWLGKAADGSDDFLRYAKEPGQISFGEFFKRKNAFFQRSYWNRTWVVQENLRAKEVVFIRGSSSISRSQLLSILSTMQVQVGMTGYDSAALALLSGQSALQSQLFGDGGLSHLLVAHCESKCANEPDRVYALLGILSSSSPASSLPIEYSIDNAQLFLRAIEVMDILVQPENNKGVEALKTALGLSWPTIISSMSVHEARDGARKRHINNCHVEERGGLRKEHKPSENRDRRHFEKENKIAFDGIKGRGFWVTNVEVQARDAVYSAPGAKYAFILRWHCEIDRCVGGAWNVGDYRRPGKDVKSLLRHMKESPTFSDVVNNGREDDDDDEGTEYVAHAPSRLLAMIEAFTKLMTDSQSIKLAKATTGGKYHRHFARRGRDSNTKHD